MLLAEHLHVDYVSSPSGGRKPTGEGSFTYSRQGSLTKDWGYGETANKPLPCRRAHSSPCHDFISLPPPPPPPPPVFPTVAPLAIIPNGPFCSTRLLSTSSGRSQRLVFPSSSWSGRHSHHSPDQFRRHLPGRGWDAELCSPSFLSFFLGWAEKGHLSTRV